MFDELVHRVGPRTQKSDSNFRKAIEPGKYLDTFVTVRLCLYSRCGCGDDTAAYTLSLRSCGASSKNFLIYFKPCREAYLVKKKFYSKNAEILTSNSNYDRIKTPKLEQSENTLKRKIKCSVCKLLPV